MPRLPFTLLENTTRSEAWKEGEAMRAAIYCRVSTDNQEKEGTSLETQLEACLKYCQSRGYNVTQIFTEVFSGLSLERPELDKLRELVRAKAIDVVVVYCLDRLTRDPGHGVIITQELEKHGVKLEAVTEDVDNTELGKLITYIRGYASKVEAEKIRERSIRGKRAKAKEGSIPGGGGTTIYGYDYIKVSQENGGRRVVNETEASWVRQMFEWLVSEGLSTNAIMYRLRATNAPTKYGKMWGRHSVHSILTNPSYTGKTYVFTTTTGRKRFTRPKADWIEIPGVTPAIISQELFDAAQKQLRVNQERSPRNCKREYLLGGHIKCRECGRSYAGTITSSLQHGKRYIQRRYRCMGRLKMYSPLERCHNKGWSANKLEGMVWAELERYLSQPELIIRQLEAHRQDANQLGVLEAELERVERQLKAVDREQHQLLQWALKGFPENQVEAENKRLNKAKETLKAQRVELQAQIKASRDAAISIPKLENFIRRTQAGIANLDFKGKRQVFDALDIKVWLDGENVEVTGVIPTEEDAIVPTLSL